MADRPEGGKRAGRLQTVVDWVPRLAVVFIAAVVLLQLIGVIDILDEDEAGPVAPATGHRLPGEHLYLDDERVDAYLSQLRGGLAPSERQQVSVTRSRNAQLALQQVVQVGASVEEQQLVERTVSSRAADRFYLLEAELMARFGESERAGLRFGRVRANVGGCRQIRRDLVRPGQIIRITGAHLRVPTYALALGKVAHAAQFLASHQPPEGVSPEGLSRLAGRRPQSLGRFVDDFGPDPRLPFRLIVGRTCTVFLPARYAKLVDAPSLLTGQVTVVGKVVRTLTGEGRTYFDVETAARYGRAVQEADREILGVLGLGGADARELVNESARVAAPALVVLPLAIYK
jgi:hypothetical protein